MNLSKWMGLTVLCIFLLIPTNVFASNQTVNQFKIATVEEFTGTGDFITPKIEVDKHATLLQWSTTPSSDIQPGTFGHGFDMWYYDCSNDGTLDEDYCDEFFHNIHGDYGYAYLYNDNEIETRYFDISAWNLDDWILKVTDTDLKELKDNTLSGIGDQTTQTALFQCDGECTINWVYEQTNDANVFDGLSVIINEYDMTYKSDLGWIRLGIGTGDSTSGSFLFEDTGWFYLKISSSEIKWWNLSIDTDLPAEPTDIDSITPHLTNPNDKIINSDNGDLNFIYPIPGIMAFLLIQVKYRRRSGDKKSQNE